MTKTDGYGYFGHWNDEVHASPAAFRKLELPPDKKAVLILSADRISNVYTWTCKDCGAQLHTDGYIRPPHTCNT